MRITADARRFSSGQHSLIFAGGVYYPEAGICLVNSTGIAYALVLLYGTPLKIGRRFICWNPHEGRLEEMTYHGGSQIVFRGSNLEEDAIGPEPQLRPPPARYTLRPTAEAQYYRNNQKHGLLFHPGTVSAVFYSPDSELFSRLVPSHRLTTVREDYMQFPAPPHHIWRAESLAVAGHQAQELLSPSSAHSKIRRHASLNGWDVFDRVPSPEKITVTTIIAG